MKHEFFFNGKQSIQHETQLIFLYFMFRTRYMKKCHVNSKQRDNSPKLQLPFFFLLNYNNIKAQFVWNIVLHHTESTNIKKVRLYLIWALYNLEIILWPYLKGKKHFFLLGINKQGNVIFCSFMWWIRCSERKLLWITCSSVHGSFKYQFTAS